MSDDSNTDKNSELTPNSEDTSKDETSDKFRVEPANYKGRIEKAEEKIDDKKRISVSANYKSERKTIMLSVLAGLFGVMGLGHIYLGRIRRGIFILIIVPLSWTMIFVSGAMFELAGLEEEIMAAAIRVLGGIILIVVMGFLVLFIWQILNSRKLCKEYNKHLEQQGIPPW